MHFVMRSGGRDKEKEDILLEQISSKLFKKCVSVIKGHKFIVYYKTV